MAFARPMKKGIIALTTDEGDTLVGAKVTNGNQNVILVSRMGQSIRFEEAEIRAMGRTARGVQGMRLDQGDEVIGIEIITPGVAGTQILTVTEKGYGKRTPTDEYRVQGRGGSGIMTMRITDKNGPVVAVRQVLDEDQLILASNQGKVIRTRISEISEVGRVAQGVKLIDLEAGEKVGAVAKIVEKEDDDMGDGKGDGGAPPPPTSPVGNA